MGIQGSNESVGVIRDSDRGGIIVRIEGRVRKPNRGTQSTSDFIRVGIS